MTRSSVAQRVALTHHQAGRYVEALCIYRGLATRNPDDANLHQLFGAALVSTAAFAEGIKVLERAVALDPLPTAPRKNLLRAYFTRGRMEDAYALSGQLAAEEPDDVGILRGHMEVCTETGRFAEALEMAEDLCARCPDDVDAHWRRALLLLTLGDYQRGWREYEWRFKVSWLSTPQTDYPFPLWDGRPLDGQRIFLYTEQGLGDAVQFLRFLPEIRRRGGRVVLGTQRRMADLLRGHPDIEEIASPGDVVGDIAAQAPLLSLGRILDIRVDTIPAQVPYLPVDDAERSRWEGRFKRDGLLHVGLAWRGNPSHKNDRHRSMAFATLAPLLETEGIRFHSLQQTPADEDMPLPPSLDDVATGGLSETAAAIAAMDLVITVDTVIAHLAGALGRPAWVMLAKANDWRWLTDREDTPWYPTLRLFRQRAVGDWSPVIDAIVAELKTLTGKGR